MPVRGLFWLIVIELSLMFVLRFHFKLSSSWSNFHVFAQGRKDTERAEKLATATKKHNPSSVL